MCLLRVWHFFQKCVLVSFLQERSTGRMYVFFSFARESEYDLFMRGYYIYFDAFYRHRIFACKIVHHYHLIHRNYDKEKLSLSFSLTDLTEYD